MTRVNLDLFAAVSRTLSGSAGRAAAAAKGVFSGLMGQKLSVNPDAGQSQSNAGQDSVFQKCSVATQNDGVTKGKAASDETTVLPAKTKGFDVISNPDAHGMDEMLALAIMQNAFCRKWEGEPETQYTEDSFPAAMGDEKENPPVLSPVHSGSFFKQAGVVPDGLGLAGVRGFNRMNMAGMNVNQDEAPEKTIAADTGKAAVISDVPQDDAAENADKLEAETSENVPTLTPAVPELRAQNTASLPESAQKEDFQAVLNRKTEEASTEATAAKEQPVASQMQAESSNNLAKPEEYPAQPNVPGQVSDKGQLPGNDLPAQEFAQAGSAQKQSEASGSLVSDFAQASQTTQASVEPGQAQMPEEPQASQTTQASVEPGQAQLMADPEQSEASAKGGGPEIDHTQAESLANARASVDVQAAQAESKNDVPQTADLQGKQPGQQQQVSQEQHASPAPTQSLFSRTTATATGDAAILPGGARAVFAEPDTEDMETPENLNMPEGVFENYAGAGSASAHNEPIKMQAGGEQETEDAALLTEQFFVENAADRKTITATHGKASAASSGQRATATMDARARAASRFAAIGRQMEVRMPNGVAEMQGKTVSGEASRPQEGTDLTMARAEPAERRGLNGTLRTRESEPDGSLGAKIEPAPTSPSAFAATQAAALRQSAQAQNAERVERLQELIARLDEHILELHNGETKSMRLQLTPPNLGRVSLSCHEEAGSLRVEISVENESVRNMLQQQERHLRDALEHGGYRLAQFDVRADGQGLQHESRRRQASAPRRQQRAAAIEVDAPKEAEPVMAQSMLGKETVWYIA